MKRMMVFVTALALVTSPCFYKTVKAKEIKEERIESQERKPDDTTEEPQTENEASETEKTKETEEPLSEDDTVTERDMVNEDALNIEEGTTEGSEDEADGKTEEKLSLLVPQSIEIVMDPWEMDGKEQIYSKEYIVKNCGETEGHLVLSELTCKPQTEEIHIQTDKEGIHTGDEKSAYMEMVFGGGEKIVLSQEDSRYETDLEPGEEVSFRFSGEVNEYASADWTGSDVAVNVVYSWETELEEKNILSETDDPAEPPKEKDETIKENVEDLLHGKDKAVIDGRETDDIEETEEDEKVREEEIMSSTDEPVEEKAEQ